MADPNIPVTPAGAALASNDNTISVLSYNVLMPNSVDGWWVYKYYSPRTDPEKRVWQHRQQLLKAQLMGPHADLICLQECVAESFESDFGFLLEAGYQFELIKKGRMRVATLWREDRLTLVKSFHKDRTLVSQFTGKATGATVFLVNCHLTAGGAAADRRLRQVHQALETVRKANADPALVVVCGDLNCDGATAAHELLVSGSVTPDFQENGKPVTSKIKSQVLGQFTDAYSVAYHGAPPATMACSNLVEHMVDAGTGQASVSLRAAIKRMFDGFVKQGETSMGQDQVNEWLVAINGVVGRGSEFRSAQAILEEKQHITWDDFVGIYQKELNEGKYWGVEHDLVAVSGSGMAVPGDAPFTMKLDHIYFAGPAVRCCGVSEPMSAERHQQVFVHHEEILPCDWHPSDHMPIAAVLEI